MTLSSSDATSLMLRISAGLQGQLEFVRCGDRYAQRLVLIRDGEARLALSSQEADEGGDWPPSPPLQQLSFHQTPQGGTCALLVGMAGRSHWSLSVEPQGEAGLIFDVACRMHCRPSWLGSRYHLPPDSTVQPDGSWRLPCGGGAVRLAAWPCGPDSALDGLDLPAGFTITPRAEPGPLPATLRWKYRLQLADAGDAFCSGAAT